MKLNAKGDKMPTFVYFGDRFFSGKHETESSIMASIRESMTSWTVIDSSSYGRSSRDGMTRFQDDVLMYEPDLVAIMFGIHDAMSPNEVPIPEYRTNLLYMVNKVLPKKTILISPLIVEEEKHSLVKIYDEEMQRVAEETGSTYLDLLPLSKDTQHVQEVLIQKLHIQLFQKEGQEKQKRNFFDKFNLGLNRVF